jgi:Poly(ADP-ribose) polymerase and DNA-Ligase Zn-finger region.
MFIWYFRVSIPASTLESHHDFDLRAQAIVAQAAPAPSLWAMADAERERLVEVVVKLVRLKPERRKEIEAKVVAGEGITSKSSRIDVSMLQEALKRTDMAYASSMGKCNTDVSMHSVMSEAATTPLGVVESARYQVPHTPPASGENDPAFGTVAAELAKDEDINVESEVSAIQGKRSAQIFVDISKTGRCTCHVCNEQIAAGSVRCGQDRFGNGITKTRYTHALCFLQGVSCGYAPANRGRCQASEAPFARGDLRVKFDAVKTSYWLPEEAGTRIFKILEALQPTPHLRAEAVDGLRKMEGLQS